MLAEISALLSLPVQTARRAKEQWLPREQLLALRRHRLERLLHVARAAPFYAERLAPAFTNGSVDLRNIEPVTKRELALAGIDAFLTSGREGLITVTTSGSTGQPAMFLRSPSEETEFSARWWRVYSAYGAHLRDTLLNLGRTNCKPRPGAVTLMRNLHLLPRIVTVAVAAPVAEAARLLCELRPRFVTGFAIGVEALAEHVLQHRIAAPPLRAVMCGAMEVTDHCRELVRAAFHAPAVNVYGTNEFGVIGWECPQRTGVLHINEDAFELEILDGNEPVRDGEEGEIVLTALTLTRMPLIRFRTGDIAARLPDRCPCGRALASMTPVKGRTAHAIRMPSGGLITAPLLASAFGFSSAYDWARRFQVREEEGGALRVLVECHRPPSAEQRARLLDQLKDVTAHEYELRLELQNELALAPTGKFQYVVPLTRSNASHAA